MQVDTAGFGGLQMGKVNLCVPVVVSIHLESPALNQGGPIRFALVVSKLPNVLMLPKGYNSGPGGVERENQDCTY